MRSFTTILKFQWCVMHSVRWSQLRRIKRSNESWSRSGSVLNRPARTERSTCSRASSSLRWQITLSNGMIIAETSGTSSQASGTIRETLRRCSGSLKVTIDTIWYCQSQSICLGRHMDGSDHRDSQMSSPVLKIKSFLRFICSKGSAMRSITYYLRVAHSFMFNCHSETGHGRYYIYSGTLMGQSRRHPGSVRGSQGKNPQDRHRSGFNGLHRSGQAQEMFNMYQSASSFMNQHVLFHESVAISNWYLSETILEIMQHPQVRLTERIIKIIRGSHPHMESLLISGVEFRLSITEPEIDRSFAVVDMRINRFWTVFGP